jgi:hypothetical protein
MTDPQQAKQLVERLLPCPFCGSEPLIEDGCNDRPWVVQCMNKDCSAQPFMDHADTKRQAVRTWNTRLTATPPADGEVEALTALYNVGYRDGEDGEYNPDGAIALWPAIRPAQPADLARKVEIAREAPDIALAMQKSIGTMPMGKLVAYNLACRDIAEALAALEPHP